MFFLRLAETGASAVLTVRMQLLFRLSEPQHRSGLARQRLVRNSRQAFDNSPSRATI
jgi:hypothetical protein